MMLITLNAQHVSLYCFLLLSTKCTLQYSLRFKEPATIRSTFRFIILSYCYIIANFQFRKVYGKNPDVHGMGTCFTLKLPPKKQSVRQFKVVAISIR